MLVSKCLLFDSKFVHTTSKVQTTSCVFVVYSNFTELDLLASSAPSFLFLVTSLSRLLQVASVVALGIVVSFVIIVIILLLDFDGSVALVCYSLCFEF